MTEDKGKVTIDDIVQLDKHTELVDSAKKMMEVNEERFNLLICFVEENKDRLLQKIDITKYIDNRIKIKEGMEEEYHKASFPESLKFCEEKKKDYYEDEGIFLGNRSFPLSRQGSSFFRSSSSSSYRESEFFYIPVTKDFLETKKTSTHNSGCFGGHSSIETLDCKKISKEEVMKKIDLLKLTKKLKDFLTQGGYKGNFSSFYKDWSRDLGK